jgi:multisubunit Na+/H+ antiporter MnhG subunit
MGMFSPPCVMMAVLCEEGFSQAGLKAILICLLLTAQGPVLAHVLGRAVWAREHHMDLRKRL